MELVRPAKQAAWGWPGTANFILGGMAAGFYLLSSLVMILRRGAFNVFPFAFEPLAPVLTGLGLLTLMMGTLHIKGLIVNPSHLMQSRHLFRHLRYSWMSRESLASIVFIWVAFLDWLFPSPVLWGLGVATAAVVIISHGFIIYRVRAVVAWSMPLVPLLFLTSSLAAGSGLMLLLAPSQLTLPVTSVVAGLICIGLDLVVWLSYLNVSRDVAFREATASLRRSNSLIFIVGIGHLFPALLLLIFLIVPDIGTGIGLWRILTVLAGLAMIVGVARQKFGIVLTAGYLRGIVMGRYTG